MLTIMRQYAYGVRSRFNKHHLASVTGTMLPKYELPSSSQPPLLLGGHVTSSSLWAVGEVLWVSSRLRQSRASWPLPSPAPARVSLKATCS